MEQTVKTMDGVGKRRRWDRICQNVADSVRNSFFLSQFCHPSSGRAVGVHWKKTAGARLLEGSLFLHSSFFCFLPVALAAVLPTMAVLGLLLLAGISVIFSYIHEPEPLLGFSETVPLFVYLLVYGIAVLRSGAGEESLYPGCVSFFITAFSLILFYGLQKNRAGRTMLAGMMISSAGVALFGCLQYLFRWGYQSEAWLDHSLFSSAMFRVSATLQNPNMLGHYLILMIPLGTSLCLTVSPKKQKAVALAGTVLSFLCLIVTFSRGAWISLLLAGACFLLLLWPRWFFLLPPAVLVLLGMAPGSVRERFLSIANASDSTSLYRWNIWRGVSRMLEDGYWLLGVGPGEKAFNLVYPYYALNAIVTPHAHNLYLQMICEGGVFLLLAFLWTMVRWFRHMFHSLYESNDPKEKTLIAGFVSGATAFLLQALTDYSFYNYRVMLVFWMYLAVGLALAKERRDRL